MCSLTVVGQCGMLRSCWWAYVGSNSLLISQVVKFVKENCKAEYHRHNSLKKHYKSQKTERLINMKRAERKQPTHFVAIQIKNEEIHSRVKETQLKFVEGNNKILERALISPKRLHITMMVMLLKDETDLQQAKLALDVAASEIMKNLTQPLILHVAGLNKFGKNVLYAVPNNDKLSTIAEIVKKSFCDKGLFSTDSKNSTTFHITLMKLSQDPNLYYKGVRRIDSSVWEEYKDSDFGLERVTSLQLCAMNMAADDSGYYEICHVSSFMQDTETG